MLFCIRIVQEFERAVIFRLGRVRKNGTVGPGLFFIVPCMDQVIYLGIYLPNILNNILPLVLLIIHAPSE